MHSKLRFLLLSLCLISSTYSSETDTDSYTPYYSGTLLAFFSENIPPGLLEIQPFLFQTNYSGTYDKNWSFQKSKSSHDLSLSLLLETGITKYVDFTLFLNTTYNQLGNHQSLLYEDTQVYLGFQALLDKRGTWTPDVRFVLGENFPTGQYQQLTPDKKLSDVGGSGA
jgi:hypothetical protein